ncbi:MAG: chemotaxis protein CheA [Planctomycetota bacterium]
MGKRSKLTELVQQAASAITMASAADLSDIENLQDVFTDISKCVKRVSKLSSDLKAQAKDAVSSAGGLVEKLLAGEAEDAEQSLKVVSETIISLEQLNEQILRGVKAKDILVDFPDPFVSEKGSADVSAESSPSDSQDDSTDSDEASPSEEQQPVSKAPADSGQSPAGEDTVIEEDDADLVVDFIAEAAEHIESAEAGLLELEGSPGDDEAINLIFRGFHTIKGMAGFLNLVDIGSLAHAAENLLDLARKGNIELAGTTMDLVFESVDVIKTLIKALQVAIEGSKVVSSNPELPDLLARLKSQLEPQKSEAEPGSADAVSVSDSGSGSETPAEGAKSSVQSPSKQSQSATTKQMVTDEKIKVSTSRLDNLVNMAGELVIAQAMVVQEAEASLPPEHELCQKVGHQAKIVRELQELSMLMRMVPIQGVFQKMARLVRDLSQKSGKAVTFSTEGEETELDRIVVDQIADPLVHMVRNSVDHGIESSEGRAAAGKSSTGRVTLRAFHQAGNIVIEIEDDGKGLDKDKILKKAVENGVLSPNQEMSDQDIYKLIFHAGLSTAAKVTEISGRGVGMDVVRKNIEALRGKIEIDSVLGQGTTFTIRLPLTMAIIEGQVVRIGTTRYIIPIVSIESCLRPAEDQISTVQDRAEMASVQGDLLPIVRLYDLFGAKPDSEVLWESALVVVSEDGNRGCLMVDELLGQQQVVIKSLGEGMGNVKGVSGGAIMGDGRVSLILDIPGLLELAQH